MAKHNVFDTIDVQKQKDLLVQILTSEPPYKSIQFEYDWYIPLSKYNTLRYEDKNREIWKQKEIGEYVRNDRFACAVKPAEIEITIRKTYKIPL